MKTRCLVVLAGGGWYEETRRVLALLSPARFEFVYAYAHHSGDHSAATLALPHPGPMVPLHYLGYTRPRRFDRLRHAYRTLLALGESRRIIRQYRPQAVLAIGCASAVPLFTAARLQGISCVFIESITRSRELSLTGRIVYWLRLAKVFVQWPRLARRRSRCAYAGAVL